MPEAAAPDLRRVHATTPALLDGLCALLIDAVHGGASVGFLAPLSPDTARRYWQTVLAALGDHLCLWVAEHEGAIVGSVQLALCEKENGRHRAEVQKLFVLQRCRGLGIASRLMHAVEAHARASQRSTLVLDTLLDSPAEAVYRHLGWHKAGEIPAYAASPDGALHATVVYYKLLALEATDAVAASPAPPETSP